MATGESGQDMVIALSLVEEGVIQEHESVTALQLHMVVWLAYLRVALLNEAKWKMKLLYVMISLAHVSVLRGRGHWEG